MIEARGLVKRYGSTMAVSDLSFSIRPGMVTGFLGPNGAGKTTTMRMILGLDAPTQGSVTVGGPQLPRPAGARSRLRADLAGQPMAQPAWVDTHVTQH
jgi:ABC-2 type transport system ATP-binding protein